ARRAPRVWRELYVRSDGPDEDRAFWGPYAARTLFRPFARLLRSRRWAQCVCTHFLPSQLAAGGAGMPPFSLVITDHTLHRYWVQPRVGTYFVANRDVSRGVRARLPHARIEVTGIPVDPVLSDGVDLAATHAEYGLSGECPIVLI